MATRKDSGMRILLTSSLAQSPLNNHILEGIVAAFQDHADVANVRYLQPQDLTCLLDLGEYDLLIFIGSALSEPVPHYMIASKARNEGVPSVFWATDDPYEFDARYRASLYDIYISNDLNAAQSLLERDRVYHLALAAPPNDLREITPHEERAKGMFFCGYPFSNRKLIVEDILNLETLSRNDLVVSGPNWNNGQLNVMASPETHDALINIYAGSEFILNMGRSFNLANEQYNLVASTPGPRTFECALAGTPQLFFGNVTEIEPYFVPDEEILVCDSVEDLERHVKTLRANPERWESVARKGQERALRDHLYANRAEELLQIVQDSGVMHHIRSEARSKASVSA